MVKMSWVSLWPLVLQLSPGFVFCFLNYLCQYASEEYLHRAVRSGAGFCLLKFYFPLDGIICMSLRHPQCLEVHFYQMLQMANKSPGFSNHF